MKIKKDKRGWKIGVPRTEETKIKISQSLSGVKFTNDRVSGFKGKKWTPEMKEKARLTRLKNLTKIRKKYNGKIVKSPIIKNGKQYDGSWVEIRKVVYERDSWTCQECLVHCHGNGTKDKIQCHHIDYDTTNCDIKNLITLCASCHAKTNFNRKDWINYFRQKTQKELKRCTD